MSEVKVNLNITLPGRVMLSEQVAQNKPENYDVSSMEVFDSFKKKRDRITIKTRKTVPAKQSINISIDAYNSMISQREIPYFITQPREWVRMSKKQRLEAHLSDITEALGGISYTYIVFEE